MTDIVTKEMLESYRAKHWILEGELTYNTITQAVELLEDVECSCWYIPPYQRCKQCDARQDFLARYHAADSSPQSQPSPPQK